MDEDDLDISSIYDGEEKDEDDLWFMPFDEESGSEAGSDVKFIFHYSDWIDAERSLAGELAEANYLYGCLDERIRLQPLLKDRIARLEAVELAWLSGHRVGHDILNKHLVLADSIHERDQRAISETRWAYQRYMSSLMPIEDSIRDVLGRNKTYELTDSHLIKKTTGTQFEDLYEEFEEYIKGAIGLQRLSLGALSFFAWQSIEVSGESDFFEAAVISQKISAQNTRKGGLGFVPLALGGKGAFLRSGTIEQRLKTWYRLIENACQRAILDLNSVEIFKKRALEVSFKQTKTYEKIIESFVNYPVLNVNTLMKTADIGKDAALKYIDLMEDDGLIAEITGTKKFRFWRISKVL